MSVGLLAIQNEAYHFDFEKCFVAVIKKVPRFSAIDSHDSKEELATETQCHRRGPLIDDRIDATFDVRLQDV